MEARRYDCGEIRLDIAELSACIVGQAGLDEEVDRHLLAVLDLPPLAGRVPLLVDVRAEPGAAQSLRERPIAPFIEHRQS